MELELKVNAAHLFQKHSNINIYLDLQTGSYKALSGETHVSFIQFSSGHHEESLWWGRPQCEMLPPALWNHTGDLKLTQSLWPLWPGCYITTGGSWPLCGLLCVSLESAGCSWSSDLCCWTRLAPSGHHTPPETRMERKRDNTDSDKGKQRQGKRKQNVSKNTKRRQRQKQKQYSVWNYPSSLNRYSQQLSGGKEKKQWLKLSSTRLITSRSTGRKRLIERLRQGRGESQQSSNKTQTCTSRLSLATPKPRCWHSLKELWWMAECWRWSTPWCWLTKTDVGQMGRRQWEMGHRLPWQQVVDEGSRRPEMVDDKKKTTTEVTCNMGCKQYTL